MSQHDHESSTATREPRSGKSPAPRVLGVSFLLAALGRGLHESFTVFLLPVAAEFSITRAETLSVYSLAALVGGLSSPWTGRLFDRLGPRWVYMGGLSLLSICLLLASWSSTLWELRLSLGIGVGFGAATIGIVPGAALLARWYSDGLPRAMAVLHCAAGVGVLLITPAAQALVDAGGWRIAYRGLSVAVLLILAVLTTLPWARWAIGDRASVKVAPAGGLSFNEAGRHPALWGLLGTFLFTACGMFSISAQVIAYLVHVGFSPIYAAAAWGFSGAALAAGMLSTSLLDRAVGRRASVLCTYVISFAGIGLLWLLSIDHSWLILAGFVVCFGGTIGCRSPLIAASALTIFRGQHSGTIFGTIQMGAGLGAALGAWMGGAIQSYSGSYDPVFGFAAVSIFIGMLPFMLLRSLR
jgi:MFS family permease